MAKPPRFAYDKKSDLMSGSRIEHTMRLGFGVNRSKQKQPVFP
jgi:hypothetical protein